MLLSKIILNQVINFNYDVKIHISKIILSKIISEKMKWENNSILH